MTIEQIRPSDRVRVIQTITTAQGPWRTSVEGTVVSVESKPTGSWYAHGKHDRLWLRRLRLRRADGEIVELNVDGQSEVEKLS